MTETTRRTVLIAGGAIGAAGVLAACGSSQSNASSSQPSPTQSSSGGGVTLGPATDVPVKSGKVYEAQEVVVTQPAAGEFHAFSAVCPHQGCLVSEVADNAIVCPCHGSLFNATTGAVERGPAVKGLAPVTVTDANGSLVLE